VGLRVSGFFLIELRKCSPAPPQPSQSGSGETAHEANLRLGGTI
jgi:hypothetical protein